MSRRRSRRGGPVVELGVGTGRIAIPTAMAGVHVIGVDSSAGMLAVCAGARARGGGRRPARPAARRPAPAAGRRARPARHLPVPRLSSTLRPTRSGSRRSRAARKLLRPGGRLVFDVFAPSAEDIEETHGRWIEREPGIDERADWDLEAQTLTLSVRGAARRVDDDAVVARARAVALAARRSGLRGRRVLRLVRPAAVRGRRGHGLGRSRR